MSRPKLTPINSKEEFMSHMQAKREAEGLAQPVVERRLSNFAQDALLSVIYRLEGIEDPSELSTLETEILATARRFDREREESDA